MHSIISVQSAASPLYPAAWVFLEFLCVLTRVDRAFLFLVRLFFHNEYHNLCNLSPFFSVVQKMTECLINNIIDWIKYSSMLLGFFYVAVFLCVVMS